MQWGCASDWWQWEWEQVNLVSCMLYSCMQNFDVNLFNDLVDPQTKQKQSFESSFFNQQNFIQINK